jgi:tRNA(Ile)-lysidine synthase
MLALPRGAATIVVACSGGADSGAALHVVRACRPAARLIACYVDHGIRPAASIERDRRAVRAQARAAGADVETLRLTDRPPRGASIEAALRAARYRSLADFAHGVGARCVVSGHQRDDVAESTLLALVRGSGIDGVAAMRPRRSIGRGVDLVRPLLWASKKELVEYAAGVGLRTSKDETNDDPRFLRNAVRRLIAGLEAAAPGAGRAIARSAALAVEDKALLDAITVGAWTRCAAHDGASLVAEELRKLSLPLLRRVLRFEVKRVTGTLRDFGYDHCAAAARAIRERRGGTHHAGAARIVLSGGRVTVSQNIQGAAPTDEPVSIEVPRTSASFEYRGGRIVLRSRAKRGPHRARRCLELDGDALPAGAALTVRSPETGDRFRPPGRKSNGLLARFLSKEGLTRDERSSVPLLCRDGLIVGVLGVRPGAAFIARPGGRVLEASWQPPKAAHRRFGGR